MIPQLSLRKALVSVALIGGITVPTAAAASAAANTAPAAVSVTAKTASYVVQAGSFKTKAAADRQVAMLVKKGITGFSVQAAKGSFKVRTAAVTAAQAKTIKASLTKAKIQNFSFRINAAKKTAVKTTAKKAAKATTVVYAGAGRTKANAEALVAKLAKKKMGFLITQVQRGNQTWYVVHTTKIPARDATIVMRALRHMGIKNYKMSSLPTSSNTPIKVPATKKKTTVTTKSTKKTTTSKAKMRTVISGSFKTEARAKVQLGMIAKKGITGFTIQTAKVKDTTYYRVQTAKAFYPKTAKSIQAQLTKHGFKSFSLAS